MPQRDDAWLRHQQQRFMRPDAAHWLRPDAARFLIPGTDPAEVYPALAVKANPNQPRIPKHNRFGGRWTRNDGSGATGGHAAASSGETGAPQATDTAGEGASGADLGEMLPTIEVVAGEEPASGGASFSWLTDFFGNLDVGNLFEDLPPQIPKREPDTPKKRMSFVRTAASWIARWWRITPLIGAYFRLLDEVDEIDRLAAMIKTANDPPQDLDEARKRATRPSEKGYHDHHTVNQHDDNRKRFGDDRIDSYENVVRIPALKHIELSRWYSTKQEALGDKSPQDFLRDKSWDEQMRVGIDKMREMGIIK